ncbi:hypothetical protein STENM36S_01324 [Streptomyces tendae]
MPTSAASSVAGSGPSRSRARISSRGRGGQGLEGGGDLRHVVRVQAHPLGGVLRGGGGSVTHAVILRIPLTDSPETHERMNE